MLDFDGLISAGFHYLVDLGEPHSIGNTARLHAALAAIEQHIGQWIADPYDPSGGGSFVAFGQLIFCKARTSADIIASEYRSGGAHVVVYELTVEPA